MRTQKHYLFIFDDDTQYDMTCGISFKDAVWEMAKYTGKSSEILSKALNGFDDSDTQGIIELYNSLSRFCQVIKVYIVESVIYGEIKK